MMNNFFISICCFFFILPAQAQEPLLKADQILFVKQATGYEVYIKKLPEINSVLLTESQSDPARRKVTYSLRVNKPYPGLEKETRILNRRALKHPAGSYYLIDSTPEKHSSLGEAFYFFLPEEVLYGFSWARNGIIRLMPGTKINLRTFTKKCADYTGKFFDQWLVIPADQEPAGLAEKNPADEHKPLPRQATLLEMLKTTPHKEKLTGWFLKKLKPYFPLFTVFYPYIPRVKATIQPTAESTEAVLPGTEALLSNYVFAELAYKDISENILTKIKYKLAESKQRVMESYETYHYNDTGKLVKIMQYNANDELTSYFLFEYDEQGNRTHVYHYDPAGNIIITK